jgi:hypothetical protein
MRRIAIVPDVFRKRLVLQVFRWLHGVGHCLHTISSVPQRFEQQPASVPTAYTSGAFETRAWSRVGPKSPLAALRIYVIIGSSLLVLTCA